MNLLAKAIRSLGVKLRASSLPAALTIRLRRVAKILGGFVLSVLGLTCLMSIWGTIATSPDYPDEPPIVNDVTQLNPITVDQVITPRTTEEIVDAVRSHPGPIAIGGGRYSMGGQTATHGALQIDMRQFNRILDVDPIARRITVQAGARWRQIQEHVDSLDLSVKIMQTYDDFTVGGSLSVNVHGRYIGLGPLVRSVQSLRVVLADGSLVEASPAENADIFYGVIGGYGGLGVITDATLDLADNVRIKRHDVRMPVTSYKEYFATNIRESSTALFHNADIYPTRYNTVNALTYSSTNDPVTVTDRMIPSGKRYGINRFLFWVISEWPFGKALRQRVIDPIVYRGEPVSWRNHEASYTVAELEPGSRESSTYVLQEYFVPVERFDDFIPLMRDVLQRHRVNMINVSIRHAHADPGTLLAWAPTEVFAFVMYHKQGTNAGDRAGVGVWTREMIDAVLSVGGTYYLPYQIHASEEQFLRGYPRAQEFFALKQRLDPTNKFRNRLWDQYYRPEPDAPPVELDRGLSAQLATEEGYRRDGGQTFLTHPEWYIVYSSDEYANFLKDRLPTTFPYVSSIGQYWESYREAQILTRNRYPFNFGYNVMLGVIGTSYSAELALKGVYENTVGRFSGWTSGHALSDEDRYAYEVAADYGRFIHVRPWYEYPFGSKLIGLWTQNPLFGRHWYRKWERKSFLTLEYGVKALYGGLIRMATRAAYGTQDERIRMVVTGWSDSVAIREPRLTRLRPLDAYHTLIAIPRYDVFRDILLGLARTEPALEIREIAGNGEIFLTGVAPREWTYAGTGGTIEYSLPLPTDATRKRVTMRAPVRTLLHLLAQLLAEGRVVVDHIYDY